MKNVEKWSPTVIHEVNGQYRVNRDYVKIRSLLVSQKGIIHYVELMQEHARGVLLDLGCANVPYYVVYKDQVDEIICIDWESSLHQNMHLDYTADLNSKIPLEDGVADTVILTDVLEHISQPYVLMEEITRVLAPNGKLILGVPFHYCLHEAPFDFHRYTKYQLEAFCQRNQLNIITLRESGGPLTIIFDIIIKNVPGRLAAGFFHKLGKWITSTRIGRKIENTRKVRFPLGYFLVAEKSDHPS